MRVGTICYATNQGIGHLAKWFYEAGVVTDVAVFHHSSRVNHLEWYPNLALPPISRRPFDWPEIREWMAGMDVFLFFETPFDWTVIPWLRSKGIRTYIMPMYECTPKVIPHQPDRWLCPSLLDVEHFKQWPHSFIEVPVHRQDTWQQRHECRWFLHNAGHIGLRGHKGTLEIMKAMCLVKSDIKMTIRCQDARGLAKLIDQVPGVTRDSRVEFHRGEMPYESLFSSHDVFVMAEKYNGLSLPLREARAAGMVVATSDRFPMNDWLPREPLIKVSGYVRASVSGSCMEYDEAVVRPEDVAAKIDELYGWDTAAVRRHSDQGQEWARSVSWSELKPVWMRELSR